MQNGRNTVLLMIVKNIAFIKKFRKRRELRVVSWNTNGFRDTRKYPQKFSALLEKFSTLEADIVFMQETHAGPKNYKKLDGVRGWTVYGTVYDSRRKGVAILIKNGEEVPFEYICHDEDYSGGYIVLFCRLYGELFTLVNVYNHKHDRKVLYRLKDYLKERAGGVLVIGGDFNTVLDPEFDRSSRVLQARQPALRNILKQFMSSLNLKDTWSYLHPREVGFTRSQNGISSRLDMFLMPEDTMDRVISCEINKTANEPKISDHHPLILTLRVQQQDGDKTVNTSKLKDPKHCGQLDIKEKINGAEILNAIKSLTDSGEQRPDGKSVDHHKRSCCTVNENLKKHYKHVTAQVCPKRV